MQLGRSFKLGVDPPDRAVRDDAIRSRAATSARLVRHIRRETARLPRGSSRGAASSASSARRARSSSLGALAAGARRAATDDVRNSRVSARRHRTGCGERLTSMTLDERLKLPDLDPRRADLAPAGAILLDTLLEDLGAERTHALRLRAARRPGARLHPAKTRRTSARSIGIRTCGAAA